MADTQFNSSWFWENETYEELHATEYSSRRKGVNEDFITFLTANFKELEFKKKGTLIWEYTFEQDKNEKMRVSVDKKGVHVVAMHKKEQNEDVDEEFVDRDNGETFEKLMDRIMDALEVIESKIFDLECNTKTNVGRTPKQIKNGQEKFKKMNKRKQKIKKKKNDEIDLYDPSDEDCKNEVVEQTKRRSQRIKKHNKKEKKLKSVNDDESDDSETVSKESVNKKKRKREVSVSDSLDGSDEEEETEEIVVAKKPKRKKRRVNKKKEMREMKREFTKLWISKEYHDAFVLAKDKYSMKKKQINQWIEDIYDNDL